MRQIRNRLNAETDQKIRGRRQVVQKIQAGRAGYSIGWNARFRKNTTAGLTPEEMGGC